MIPDEKTIKSRSMSVYKTLSNLLRCTFDELQNQCKLGTTELCLSIARLMQEHIFCFFLFDNRQIMGR